jgi:hypothetical protein
MVNDFVARKMHISWHNELFHKHMKNCVVQDKKCSNFKHISYEALTFQEVCVLFQQWKKGDSPATVNTDITFHYVNLF